MTPGEREEYRRLVARATIAAEDRGLTSPVARALIGDLAAGLAAALADVIVDGQPTRDRRDIFAAAALTGLLSVPVDRYASQRDRMSPSDYARSAAAYADALLAELDGKETP